MYHLILSPPFADAACALTGLSDGFSLIGVVAERK